MRYVKEWPSYTDVRCDMDVGDLREIVEQAFDVGIDQAVDDWIEANYEPRVVPDTDRED